MLPQKNFSGDYKGFFQKAQQNVMVKKKVHGLKRAHITDEPICMSMSYYYFYFNVFHPNILLKNSIISMFLVFDSTNIASYQKFYICIQREKSAEKQYYFFKYAAYQQF